jgi:hypothetical protein
MARLNKQEAEKISQLINSLTIWMLAVEREDNTTEQTIQYMTWHDQFADKLAEFGISVARYNHAERTENRKVA